MNDKLPPIEAQAFESLLEETLGGHGPPDLTASILAQLQSASPPTATLVRTHNRPASPVRSAGARPKRWEWRIAAGAALAATVLLAIGLRWHNRRDAAENPGFGQPRSSDVASAGDGAPAVAVPKVEVPHLPDPPDAPPRKPPAGIPLVLEAVVATDPPPAIGSEASADTLVPPPLQPVRLVSRQVDSQLREYWAAIGIEPSGDASREQVIARLKQSLGVELSSEAIGDVTQLQRELSRGEAAREISVRWLQQFTERGSNRIDQPLREGLIEELSACFQSQRQLDRTLAGWIGGQSENASAFYAAVSAGPKHASDTSAMIRRLAALTMNIDLRCIQCHDSYLEGDGRQQDFWDFAALLSRSVQRGKGGAWTIAPSADRGQPVFFELPDGRQGAAEPLIAAAWMKSQSGQPIRGVGQWSQQLVGSAELARGVVNSVWQLIHAQPLRGRVVDPISAPHNEALDRLEEQLVKDLLQSQFDVTRTLALVISSPATGREVPPSLLPENALLAGDEQIRSAMNAVDAFAAAQPARAALPIRDRLDQAMRAAGAKLNADGSPIVAQLAGSPDEPRAVKPDSAARTAAAALAADFPRPTNSLPVQWLASIEDQTSQVQHLAYLAGLSQVPDGVLETADLMRKADGNSTALHRVWWMLRP